MYYLDLALILACVPHVFIANNFTCVPSIGLYFSAHSSFRYALLSRGQFRLQIAARTTWTIDRWIWHIVPTDQLNGLINILLHTTFTLRFSSCCRGGWLRKRSSLPSIKSKPVNQHFSSIVSSCFVQLLPRYFRNSLIIWLYIHHNLLRCTVRRACILRRGFSKMASRKVLNGSYDWWYVNISS